LKLEGIAFYGGSFNPPTQAHRAILEDLLNQGFSKIILKPCGLRKDKETLSSHQEERADRIKSELSIEHPIYSLDLTGLDEPMKPTIIEWESLKSSYPQERIWLVTGTDLFEDEGSGKCQIQRWYEGKSLFEKAWFLIYPRPTQRPILYPPLMHFVDDFEPMDISSTQLRSLEKSFSDSSSTGHR